VFRSVTLYNQYNTAITWPFQPIVDNEYVTQAPSQSWKVGQFERVPVITGFNTDEGTGFVPRTLQTNEDFEGFFRNLLPLATESALEEIVALYPDPVTDMSSSYSANSSFGAQWNRTAAAYGDYAYVSTVRGNALGIAGQMDGKAPVWKYHFNRKVAGESGNDVPAVTREQETDKGEF
jgi:acetylcholinesterase